MPCTFSGFSLPYTPPAFLLLWRQQRSCNCQRTRNCCFPVQKQKDEFLRTPLFNKRHMYSTLSNRPHGSNSRHGATDSEKLIKNMDQINVMELGRWWKIIKDMDRIDVMIVVNISHFSKSNGSGNHRNRYGLILRHYKWRLKLRHRRVCHSWKWNKKHGSNKSHGARFLEKLIKSMDQIST